MRSGTELNPSAPLLFFNCNVLTCTKEVLLEEWASVLAKRSQSLEYMMKLLQEYASVVEGLRALCVLYAFVAIDPERTYYVLGSFAKINHACKPTAYLKSIAPAGQVSRLYLVLLETLSIGDEITIEYNVLDTPRVAVFPPWCEVRERPEMISKWDMLTWCNTTRLDSYFDGADQAYKVGDADRADVSRLLEPGVSVPVVIQKRRNFKNGSAKDKGWYGQVCTMPYEDNSVRGGLDWKLFRKVQMQRYGVACRCDRECFKRCIVETHGGPDPASCVRLSKLLADDGVKKSLYLLAPEKSDIGDAHEIRNYLAMNYYATVKTAYNVLMVITPEPPLPAMAFDPSLNFYTFPVTSVVRECISLGDMNVQGQVARAHHRTDGEDSSDGEDREISQAMLAQFKHLQDEQMAARVDVMIKNIWQPCTLTQQGTGDDEPYNDIMFDSNSFQCDLSGLGDFEDEEIKHHWRDMRRSDGLPVGMENTGNSCFIAACVQLLLHSGCFDSMQLYADDVTDDSPVTTSKQIARLLLEMFHNLRNSESIGTLMLQLRKIFKVYDNDTGGADQNDALVFLNGAICCIDENAIPTTMKRIGVDMLTVTKCGIPGCLMSSMSDPTPFTDITLDVEASAGTTDRMVLQYALNAYMSESNLVEWRCGCGTQQGETAHQVGRMTMVCHQTPKFLLLTIIRVQRDYQAPGNVQPDRKINHLLDFPLENLGFGDIRNGMDNYGSYNLLSLIRHEDFASGRSSAFSHGHYVCIAHVKNAAGNMQWLEFDDANVRIMSEQEVEGDNVKRSVVALLYQLQT